MCFLFLIGVGIGSAGTTWLLLYSGLSDRKEQAKSDLQGSSEKVAQGERPAVPAFGPKTTPSPEVEQPKVRTPEKSPEQPKEEISPKTVTDPRPETRPLEPKPEPKPEPESKPEPKPKPAPKPEPEPAPKPEPESKPPQPTKPDPEAKVDLPPELRNRPQVKPALQWLAKNQQPKGSWSDNFDKLMNDKMFDKMRKEMTAQLGPAMAARMIEEMKAKEQPTTLRVVATSYAGLALLASGDKGYQVAVDKAAQFVGDNLVRKPEDFPGQGNGMTQFTNENWQVAIGGLFLCEYCAALKKRSPSLLTEKHHQLLKKIAKECLDRMEPSGGWGHFPRRPNPLGYLELQIMSNWMLPTLGACRKLGVKVPQDKLDKAIQFIENCCSEGQGGVGYSPQPGQKGTTADASKTGGAIFAFGLLGRTDHPLYPRMVAFWKKTVDGSGDGHGSTSMGLLCSALGARQIGEEEWQVFAANFFPKIMGNTDADASFKHLEGKGFASDREDHRQGKPYNTAIYALILQLDKGNLVFLGQRHQ